MERRGPEHYDRAYFDHWYRHEGFGSPARLTRKLHYAVGAAEYLLDRPLRSVLDVGAGEGPWAPALHKLRPKASYVGVDPSRYAVERFGRRRNLRLGGLADLDDIDLDERSPYDLVVCVDVLAFAPDDDVRRGLHSIARLLGGVALVEVFTDEDAIEGDVAGHHFRTAATYRAWCAEAGLARIGPHLYANARLLDDLARFEQPEVPLPRP